MATLTDKGCVLARCPGCNGSMSTFEWAYMHGERHVRAGKPVANLNPYGRVVNRVKEKDGKWHDDICLLLRCAGCGLGGVATVTMNISVDAMVFPDQVARLVRFHPEASERLKLPPTVPAGIEREFREAVMCVEAGCLRAGAGMFRSVLDKTMRANGYKTKGVDLYNQIEAAAADGVITESRKKRAHEDIRVLGNDVLHDEWEAIQAEAVEAAHHYAQRILEDFYDDRPSTLALLVSKGRVPDEHKGAT
jgi:hypothetical protein